MRATLKFVDGKFVSLTSFHPLVGHAEMPVELYAEQLIAMGVLSFTDGMILNQLAARVDAAAIKVQAKGAAS